MLVRFVARRVLAMVPLLVVISFVAFLLLQAVPGDYVTRIELDPQITQQTVDQLRERYGLDRPVIVQYLVWLWNVVSRGDLGISFETHLSAARTLFSGGRLAWSVLVSFSTLLWMWAMAVPLGLVAAVRQYRWPDTCLTFVGYLGLSVPAFALGLFLLWLLVGVLHVGALGLGVGSLFDSRFIGEPWSWAKFLNLLWHLWPVWLVIGGSGAAGLLRVMRGSALDVLRQPYVLAARAAGLPERTILWRHVLRNAVNPLVSILGLSLPHLVSGALLASIVFNLPTVEWAFWTAILRQDPYVALCGLLFFSLLLMVGNLVADLLLMWVDPRVRYE